MEGSLEKRLVRPWGSSWVSRRVCLSGTSVSVESGESEEPKVYSLKDLEIVDTSGKARHSLSLQGRQVKVTLSANTKFEHARWLDALRNAKSRANERKYRRRTAAFSSLDGGDFEEQRRAKIKEVASKTLTHESFELLTTGAAFALGSDGSTVVSVNDDTLPLQVGDEVVGVGSDLFCDPDGIEYGAPLERPVTGLFSSAKTEEEKRKVVVVVFRRALLLRNEKKNENSPSSAAAASSGTGTNNTTVSTVASPPHEEGEAPPTEEEDEDVARFARMVAFGAPAPAVLLRARRELSAEQLRRLTAKLDDEDDAGGGAPKTKAQQKKSSSLQKMNDENEDPDDQDRDQDDEVVSKLLKMAKYGARPAQILAKARAAGLSSKAMTKLTAVVGADQEDDDDAKQKKNKTPQKQLRFRGVHWEANQAQSGSLWERRKNRDKRESLGERAETIFEENSQALKVVEGLMSATKQQPSAATKKKTKNHTQQQQSPTTGTPTKDPEQKELLDRQKALNLGIALRVVRRDVDPPESLPEQSAKLSTNALHALLEALPSDDELVRLRKKASVVERCEEGTTRFTATTTFALAAVGFHRILDACLAMRETEHDADGACVKARALERACRQVRRSKELRAAIKTAKALGNFLNADTSRGAAASIRLEDLERLEHTKGASGATAYDVLAQVLETDKSRGDEGLDAAAIDAELRNLRPLLKDTDATREHTFDVAKRLATRVDALKRNFLLQGEEEEEGQNDDENDDDHEKRKKDSPFAARCRAHVEALDAAVVALDAVLFDLRIEQNLLCDHCGQPDTPVQTIFHALHAFSDNLVKAREKHYGKSSSWGWW